MLQKILYAFTVWIGNSSDKREAMEAALILMVQLKRGREHSMYTELYSEPNRV